MDYNLMTDLEQLLRTNIELSKKALELLTQIYFEQEKESIDNLELQADLSVAKLDIDLVQLENEEKAYELKQMEKEMIEKEKQIDCLKEENQELKETHSKAFDRLSLMEQQIQNMKNSLISQSPP